MDNIKVFSMKNYKDKQMTNYYILFLPVTSFEKNSIKIHLQTIYRANPPNEKFEVQCKPLSITSQ